MVRLRALCTSRCPQQKAMEILSRGWVQRGFEDGGVRAERGEACIAIVEVSIAILITIAMIAIAPTITITIAAINIIVANTRCCAQLWLALGSPRSALLHLMQGAFDSGSWVPGPWQTAYAMD